jgi:hypothetical protein
MNYIIHLNAFLDKASKEQWVVVYHYALYMALFHIWNKTGFRKTFRVKRNDAMKAAKIFSKTTYYRCLKELEAAHLLKYYAGNSPFTPAEIEMIPLVSTQDYGTVTGSTEVPPKEKNGKVTVPGEGPLLQTNNTNFTNCVSNGPTLDDVLKLFIVHEYDTGQGLRFWYHYQALGWMLGTTPIINWPALAHKWVLNANSPHQQTANNNDHNYDESF